MSHLEDWCHDNHLSEAVHEQLKPIKEAAKLLQLRKATEKDAMAVVELCTHLSSLQVSAGQELGSVTLKCLEDEMMSSVMYLLQLVCQHSVTVRPLLLC